ncbi:hypothetical protein N9514_04245 [Pseudomonadales bacterium]|mgnify:FL=1|nr:hypothetical protein [Pseudomonadales bacterium]MDB4069223.1 hypothetical protein [Pseudomonadales bacterium]MDB4150488.1 hypothetical protein [Pseudomonadales bacterium]MDB9867141.1 hypothetical protein [Pseudomonadales bacterium]MDB9879944.1 hypothetical protein [Pseudomonadales bacterium]|tara:strand:- start:8 stop:613 length:606 start_codon:yes stop_codon:yes gene_type:complete
MKVVLSSLVLLSLVGCASAPPEKPDNLCEIFYEKSGWYKDARKAARRWGTSIPVMMAFIHQESAFQSRAKPPRTKILWVIPGPRPASAYGYSQAIDETWDSYKRSTGSWGADRNDFDDAIDFIGWYNDQSHRRNRIGKTDAYNLYLAYHEGQGGFAKRSFAKKQWLKDVSKKVARRSSTYGTQLKGCEKNLDRGWFGWLFS